MILVIPSPINECAYLRIQIKYCLDWENMDAMINGPVSILTDQLQLFALWLKQKHNWKSIFKWIKEMYLEYERFVKSPSTHWGFIGKCGAKWKELN